MDWKYKIQFSNYIPLLPSKLFITFTGC